MSRTADSLVWVLVLSVLAACSGSGGGGGGNPDHNPQTQEEALAKLSPLHRQNFENWKTKIIKSCDASSAFGLKQSQKLEADGVDGAALIRANGGSILFSGRGGFAILTSFNSFSGTGSTKVEESHQVNGQGSTILAETKRNGSQCTVSLFGQKVFETTIVQNFEVGAQLSAGQEAQSSSAIPQIRALGLSGKAEVVQHGVFSLLSQSLKPASGALVLLSEKLGIGQEQVAKMFRLRDSWPSGAAVRMANEPSAVWTNPESGNLIADSDRLKETFDGVAKTFPLEVLIEIPRFSFGPIENTADSGNYKITLDVSVSKKEAGFIYSLRSFVLGGLTAFNQEEALSCAKGRADAYRGSSPNLLQIRPSVRDLLAPCKTIHRDIEEFSYQTGWFKSIVADVFAGVSPSPQMQYGGWDQVLARLSQEALKKNQNIRTELDPAQRTRIIGVVADHLEKLKLELNRLASLKNSEDPVFQMGLSWSFRGFTVPVSRIARILVSVDNSIVPFKVSSENLLADLGFDPNAKDDLLTFAQNLNQNDKDEATKALALAKELSYSDFERDVFNQAIQKKVTGIEYQDWTAKLSSIKTELGRHSNIAPIQGDLVGLSVGWLKSGQVSPQELGSIYGALDNSIVPFDQSTKELVRTLSSQTPAHQEALTFARSLTPEYKQLALAIRENSRATDFEGWGQDFFATILQKRPSLEQVRRWNATWSAALAFTQREKQRTQNEFGSANDWNRKKVIEVAAKEGWSDVEFFGLESIGEVARSKNACDRHKGSSSLADCAGMKLFSKEKGQFFDEAFGGRYMALAKEFATSLNQLSAFEFTNLRWALVGEFFGSFSPIWSKCDSTQFGQKSAALRTQVNAIVVATDQFKKWELERQIKETLRNCQ